MDEEDGTGSRRYESCQRASLRKGTMIKYPSGNNNKQSKFRLRNNARYHEKQSTIWSILLLSRRNEVRSSCISPAHITLRVYTFFHLQDGATNVVDVVVVALLGDKGFE
jgi:hypothetical protein